MNQRREWKQEGQSGEQRTGENTELMATAVTYFYILKARCEKQTNKKNLFQLKLHFGKRVGASQPMLRTVCTL